MLLLIVLSQAFLSVYQSIKMRKKLLKILSSQFYFCKSFITKVDRERAKLNPVTYKVFRTYLQDLFPVIKHFLFR